MLFHSMHSVCAVWSHLAATDIDPAISETTLQINGPNCRYRGHWTGLFPLSMQNSLCVYRANASIYLQCRAHTKCSQATNKNACISRRSNGVAQVASLHDELEMQVLPQRQSTDSMSSSAVACCRQSTQQYLVEQYYICGLEPWETYLAGCSYIHADVLHLLVAWFLEVSTAVFCYFSHTCTPA